ncbi:hypothetical protein YT1_2690 [Rhodococcus ruber]|nr:hypothetical protein YT1_2690 [Rhodococcus ruber]
MRCPGAATSLRRRVLREASGHPGTAAASCGRSSVAGHSRAREVLRRRIMARRRGIRAGSGNKPLPSYVVSGTRKV